MEFKKIYLEPDFKNWYDVLERIDNRDLYLSEIDDPIEDPHGYIINPQLLLTDELNCNVKDTDLLLFFKQYNNIYLKLGSISLIGNDDYETLAIFLKNKSEIFSIRDLIKKKFNLTFNRNYQPHIPIAFVKRGIGKFYKFKYSTTPIVNCPTLKIVNCENNVRILNF